jgi:hypothetical protein
MRTIHIHRFHTCYRLPTGAGNERGRLDRVRGLVLEHGLAEAVERGGLLPREEVCIRRLKQTVRLRLADSDWALAQAWSLGLADAISRAARASAVSPSTAPGLDVVRYGSREHALLDLALCVSRGDFKRAWAWRQLGLWPNATSLDPAAACRQLLRSLLREPGCLVPMLGALADRGLLRAATAAWTADDWVAAAVAALKAVGSPLRARDFELGRPSAAQPPVNGPTSLRRAAALLRGSRVAGGLGPTALTPGTGGAIAALILIETEPLLTRQQSERVRPLLESLQAALRNATGENPPPPKRSFAPGVAEVARPTRGRTLSSDAEPAGVPTAIPGDTTNGPGDSPRAAEEAATEPDLRPRGRTAQGGLLFLLNVVDHLELPGRLVEGLPDRLVRWVMHALAQALAPVAPHDPAALAFAGLAPDAEPPDLETEPIRAAEREVLAGFVETIRAEVQARLAPRGLAAEAVLPFVCAREAEIVADPGWIEARFSLDAVSTDLRRAALDLDPGYLAWLGAVVKFVYE